MTIGRRIVKLKMTPEEVNAYVPPKGIDILWLEVIPIKEAVIAEFVCSDMVPDPLYRKTVSDVRHELGTTWRNRLLEDNLGTHPKSPKEALIVESIINHPYLTGKSKRGSEATPRELKKAAETAKDVHEIEMSQEETVKNLVLDSTGEKLDIEPKEVRQYRHLEQTGGRGLGNVQYREIYGPERNVFQFGVIERG